MPRILLRKRPATFGLRKMKTLIKAGRLLMLPIKEWKIKTWTCSRNFLNQILITRQNQQQQKNIAAMMSVLLKHISNTKAVEKQ